ncbi:MAG: O-antigen polysaccharide polymerase Wzy [Sedimentisphaerales bacterium]|nr:O-antigen polysaccharide polymerase Wzy [Sedimentisphaerales bacterium]
MNDTILADEFDSPEQRSQMGQDAFAGSFNKVYLAILAAEILMAGGIYYGFGNAPWEQATQAAIVFNIAICALHIVYRLAHRPLNCLAPDILYTAFYFLFHLGYLVLWMVGTVPETDTIFVYPALFPKTMLIVNLGIIGFFFGYEIAAGRKSWLAFQPVVSVPKTLWMVIGIVLMAVALAIQFGFILRVGISTFILQGYHVYAHMYQYVSDARLWVMQPKIFALGFGLYISYVAIVYKRLFKGKLGIILLGLYLFALVMEGARTPIVVVGMVLVLVRHYLIKPMKFRWLVLLGVSALVLFHYMGVVRNVTSFNISAMRQELQYQKESGQVHWYDPFVEMGGSVRTANMTVYQVPYNEPHWHGRSYVMSVAHVVPFLQGYLIRYLGASPAAWITITEHGYGAAGLGYSIASEGYLNFALPGVFLQMCVLGIILRRIYVWFVSSRSPAHTLLFVVSIGVFLVAVRGETNLIVTPLVQIALVGWLFKVISGEQTIWPADQAEDFAPAIGDEAVDY